MMDGKRLTAAFMSCIDDLSAATLQHQQRRIYECMDQACGIFCRQTRSFKSSVTITTVLGQQNYDLPPDFIDFYLQKDGRYVLRYYDGTNYCWPRVVSWDEIYRLNLTDRQETPGRVCIREKETSEALIAGTADSPGAKTNGLAILTDAAMAFLTTNRVWPRDVIHNEADGSDGYVIEVTDATHLKCALFDGDSNDWSSNDAYTIIPATEKQLMLEAPAATAGHLIVVPYIGMPNPVYSDFAFWRLPSQTCLGIAAGAAALYSIPKNSFQEAQVMNGQFLDEIRRTKTEIAQATLRSTRRSGATGW